MEKYYVCVKGMSKECVFDYLVECVESFGKEYSKEMLKSCVYAAAAGWGSYIVFSVSKDDCYSFMYSKVESICINNGHKLFVLEDKNVSDIVNNIINSVYKI